MMITDSLEWMEVLKARAKMRHKNHRELQNDRQNEKRLNSQLRDKHNIMKDYMKKTAHME